MATVRLDQLAPGMILGEHVKDRNGRILLAAGNILNARHLTIFKAWGISEVDIKGDREDMPAADSKIDPEILAKAEAEASVLFRYADLQQSTAKELFRLCVLKHLKRHS